MEKAIYKKLAALGLGEISIVGIPKKKIKRLNELIKLETGGTRNPYLKTEIFKLINKLEAKHKRNKL